MNHGEAPPMVQLQLYRPLPLHLRMMLAFILGACMPMAFSPTDMAWLGVAALAGWFLLLWTQQHTFWMGWIFGLGWFGVGAFWLADTFHLYGGLPYGVAVPIVMLVGLILGLFPALWGWLSEKIGGKSIWFLLSFILLAPLIEWLRGHLFTGLPWTVLGNLTVDTVAVGWVSVVGAYGASILPTAMAACMAALFIQRLQRAALAGLLLLGVLVACAPSIVVPEADQRVALIQGNVPQDQKWDAAFLQETLNRYNDLTTAVAADVDLIVWPEATLPFFLEDLPRYDRWVMDKMEEWQRPLLFGGLKLLQAGESGRMGQNGLYLFDPDKSARTFVGKHHLVPFGEYVPSWLPWIHQLVAGIADFMPAEDRGVLVYGDQRLGSLICYESIFPEEARSRVIAGANVLVLVTNDAWYGQSPAGWQHLQAARMRAVETGRYLLRAANT
ncbi:MAG: apolipoprotein N-acyltransferase, partial [Zetaproteobacteria bacterium]|nr:apolipoprotein N-acyltransferase [Zetaproteobacteria bacterium]